MRPVGRSHPGANIVLLDFAYGLLERAGGAWLVLGDSAKYGFH